MLEKEAEEIETEGNFPGTLFESLIANLMRFSMSIIGLQLKKVKSLNCLFTMNLVGTAIILFK